MSEKLFDVVIIGRGPVGLSMAAMVAQAGHSVALVERHRDLYGLPRAGHIDHEIMRVLQSLDAAAPVLQDSYPTTEYVWKNAAGETLLEFDWGAKGISGYNSDYMQFQPILERALNDSIVASGLVDDYSGWEAVRFAEAAGEISVTIRKTVKTGAVQPAPADETVALRARYLIAADGANSIVRRTLGIERDDLGFNEKWLVVDVRKKREIELEFDCGQICDPARPITVLPLGKRHRRWEWAMLPGESKEDLERPQTAWKLLSRWNVTPENAEIVRQLVYTFEARIAREWRRGRIFLMGDAGHTMPPFMGQGMCSGIRDAKNLTWKLDLVLRGITGDELLDTYEREREPHTRDWTVISLEAGKIPCTLDPQIARERDEKFRSGWLPPMPNFPKLETGILQAGDRPGGLAGQLSLQAPVERNGRVDLFDNHFSPRGFTIISTVADPRSVLDQRQIAFLEKLRTTFAYIGPRAAGNVDAVDIDRTYTDYFDSHGIAAVINRPDFYVFGAAAEMSDLPALVDQLIEQLTAGGTNRGAVSAAEPRVA
jgi:2-polyprenyl-6-methoxyphenol hydroxylase-like FAD-dependent oxidoreductase